MQKLFKIIIPLLVFTYMLTPQVFGQSDEELLEQLQTIIGLNTSINQLQNWPVVTFNGTTIPSDHVCAVRYTGNPALITVQQELKNQGYTITKVDGKYGAETEAAVKAFQASVGAAKVDGIIGDETRTLLSRESVMCHGDTIISTSEQISSALPPIASVCRLRYFGSDDVEIVQQELKNQGYAITKVDGKYGAETEAAVKAFQTSVGAAKVDGIISDETLKELSRESVVCDSYKNVTINNKVSTGTVTDSACRPRYDGNLNIVAIQQELKNQGYAITKVDGIMGDETRRVVLAFQTAHDLEVDGIIGRAVREKLSQMSSGCESSSGPTAKPIGTSLVVNTTPVVNEIRDPEPTSPTVTRSGSVSIEKTNVTASVRTTTAGVPDDTAVFTYLISFDNTGVIYVPTNPDKAFSIEVKTPLGVPVPNTGIDSLVSSAQKVLREDSSSYFQIEKGDTMSLRTSIQPGTGSYYAELARVSYTSEDARTVLNPAMINFSFDDGNWKSETVTLLN